MTYHYDGHGVGASDRKKRRFQGDANAGEDDYSGDEGELDVVHFVLEGSGEEGVVEGARGAGHGGADDVHGCEELWWWVSMNRSCSRLVSEQVLVEYWSKSCRCLELRGYRRKDV